MSLKQAFMARTSVWHPTPLGAALRDDAQQRCMQRMYSLHVGLAQHKRWCPAVAGCLGPGPVPVCRGQKVVPIVDPAISVWTQDPASIDGVASGVFLRDFRGNLFIGQV